MRRALLVLAALVVVAFPFSAHAVTFDVSITRAGITFVPATFFLGDRVKVYATVENMGDRDVEGSVFFSENGTSMGTPQPFSARARGSSEEVWAEWQPGVEGDRQIFVRVVTAPETRDENPANNEMIIPVTIDRDTDRDGIGDRTDTDDDNDGLPDAWEESHGLNPKDPTDASRDPDGDGRTTLDEYRAGTDPFRKESGSGGGGGGSSGGGSSGSAPSSPAPATTAPALIGATTGTAAGSGIPGVSPTTPSQPRPPKPVARPPADRRPRSPAALVASPQPSTTASNAPKGEPILPSERRPPPARFDDELRTLLGGSASGWRASLPYAAGAVALFAGVAALWILWRRRS